MTSAHLTTSRVNRLLRPLRNKCNGLAAHPQAAARATYSKQSSSWDPDSSPPLTVLCPSVGNKLTLDGHSADEFELSRRIHAVCDTFKNIVHVAYSQPCSERIPSLAAMCALVVGENMPTTSSDNTAVHSGEDSTDGNDIMDVDDIYEAVPPHYRRSLIVSHALSIILNICTHHLTLVTVLLDYCLSFGLLHESTHLLNIVLAQALVPSNPSYPPPVSHPAHATFLLDLHLKWIAGNRPPGTSSGPLPFTTSIFCQAVLGALSQVSFPNTHTFWTSEALNKLLHAVERCDIDSYIIVTRALSQTFWEVSGSLPDSPRDDTQLAALRDRLSKLMSNLFDLLFSPLSSPLAPSIIYEIIDILHDCYTARLHNFRMSTSGSLIDLADIIIMFTAHILVTYRNSIDNLDRLLAILDDSTPIPTTFCKLMAYITAPEESRAFGESLGAFFAKLEMYSSAFCSERLFELDASLWACALRHFETSIANSQKGSSALVTRYKIRLMEAVDAAECRCFGSNVYSSPMVPLSDRPKCLKRTQRRKVSGHWEWEDMVESWIRKTPVHKKRRVDDGLPRTPSRHSRSLPLARKTVSGPTSASMPLLAHGRSSSTFSSSSPSQLSEFESRTEEGSVYLGDSDKENYPSNSKPVVKISRPVRRRSSNFFSLIADAQTNRIVLHSKRQLEPRPLSSAIPETYMPPLSSQDFQHAALYERERKANYRILPHPPTQAGTLFPSDDSLDLFAYATSSPGR